MKVALLTPWKNAWVAYYQAAFEARGHEFALNKIDHPDLVLHGWASGKTQPVRGARNVMFLRRYELFDGCLGQVKWGGIDALICVNSWIKNVVEDIFATNGVSVPTHLIYNGTDLSKWRFRRRVHGKRIGMACFVHPKKNLPLALQLLARLDEDTTLHVAGDIQDPCTAEYLNHLGKRIRRRVYLYGQIPAQELDFWWEGMNYCLSTSLSEGNPNNVIEAMAKGIKPIVHDWPGADDQFAEHMRFATVEQGLERLREPYESKQYRDWVQERFSLANIEKVVDLSLGITQEKESA
jgi:glycosyltransferase involved in cell wall biosynthesis